MTESVLLMTISPLLADGAASERGLFAAAATALAVLTAAWLAARVLTAPRKATDAGSFEAARRAEIRRQSLTYRLLEPLVDEAAPASASPASASPASTTSIKPAGQSHLQVLQAAGLAPPWTESELQRVRLLEGALLGVGGALLALLIAGPIPALLAAILLTAGYLLFASARLKETAEKHRQAVLRRMPFAVDLMALVMEAGGTFDDALHSLLAESAEHPIGREFAAIARSIQLGRSRREAFGEFQTRIDQEDIREFVAAVIHGEEFGSPLAQILRNQADQMRFKRSQWAEKAAGTAEVQIVFPGMLIMAACLLVVAAPIVLRALEFL